MKKILVCLSLLLPVLSACDDDYNDQFNIGSPLTDVKSVAFTLENSDYASIAGLAANQELALSKDPEGRTYVEALEAVGLNHYFTEEAPAEDYLPAFINNKYPNADAGSLFTVTFNQYQQPAAYLNDFQQISSYDLSENDYETVWGEGVNASFLSPSTIGRIPSLLRNNVSGAEEGDMRVVNFAYSSVEPSTGGSAGEVSYTPISEVIANGAGGTYDVEGDVVATYSRGFLLSDGTGTILVYLNGMPNNAVGDHVTVSGSPTEYGGLLQFPNSSEVAFVERSESFAYPDPKAMSGVEMDAWCDDPSVQYVSITGVLSISGYYYNLAVDGAEKQGSISYPVTGVVDESLDGQEVTVEGYLIGSNSNYVNMMATSVVAAGTEPVYTPVGVIALSEAGDYQAKGVVVAVYNRGFLMSDGTGTVLVYLNGAHDYAVGDMVTVDGSTSVYANLIQFGASSTVTKLAGGSFSYPKAQMMEAADMDAYLGAPRVAYVTYEGTLNISGNYYNVYIDGAETATGSISYPVDGLVDESLNGERVVVTGYTIGVSSGRYVNTMATSVEAAASETQLPMALRALRATAASPANASLLYVYDGSSWSEYTTGSAEVAVVSPDVYEAMGTYALEKPEEVLPLFLQEKYPYALAGDIAAVVYLNEDEAYDVMEFTMGDSWTATPVSVPVTLTFSKEDGGISANASTFLSESFLGGDDGGFTVQNILLGGGISYVWNCRNEYGWTASAYYNSTNCPAESWLVSTPVDLSRATAPVMTFDEAINFLSGNPTEGHLDVKITTDYTGDVQDTEWDDLTVKTRADGGSWTFVNVGDIDLSAYVGHTVYVAFKYTVDGSFAPTWEIKNLVIKEKEEGETSAE